MARPTSRWSLVWLLSALAAFAAFAGAQDQRPATPDPEQTVAAIQARLDATGADTTLAADLKASLLEILGRALANARQRDTDLAARQRHLDAIRTAPERLQTRTDELALLARRTVGPERAGLTLPELEQGLAAAQREQTEASNAGAELDKEIARRAERRTAVPKLLADARARLDALPAAPADAADSDPRLGTARRLAHGVERSALQAQIDALTTELQSYDAETELQRTERDLATRRAGVAKSAIDAWLGALQPERTREAARAEQEAQQRALVAHPQLQQLADANAELARKLAETAKLREQAEDEKAATGAELQRLQQDFQEVKRRVELAGASEQVGPLLRHRRASLATSSRQSLQRTRSRAELVADAQFEGLDYEERRQRLIEDPEAWLAQQLGAPIDALPVPIAAEAQRLRDAHLQLLTQVAAGQAALLSTQLDVSVSERALRTLVATYEDFVIERVLGIRSAKPIWQLEVDAALDAAAWLANGSRWRTAAATASGVMVRSVWPLLAVAVFLSVLAMRFTLTRRLVAHGERALRGNNVAYAPTALALVETVLLIAPLPALVWLFGWCLTAGSHGEFTEAVGLGLRHGSIGLALALALRAVVRPKGLAEAHFRWQTTTVAHLRQAIPLLLIATVLAFVIGTLELTSDDRWLGSLGALALLAQLAVLTIAFWRLLHPTRGVSGASVGAQHTAIYRFRKLWFVLGVGVPLVLFAMVVLGYQYTALQLARRLLATAGVVLLGVLVQALILRGLVLERRRLQIQKAKQLLAADKGDAAAKEPETAATAAIDPQSLTRQTQNLLNGVVAVIVLVLGYQIWNDVLPALGALRSVTLWDGGTPAAPVVVTLADLLSAIAILLAAAIAARNLPALLELLVLRRTSMQPGGRHAVKTLATYFVFLLGIGAAFGRIDIGWSKIQWLVAAVSVGLGFGLQEIFANFVSGLILLFEQPVRVGDLVTVAGTSGRVTRIRIRATTIQDGDRKELIVPNREFVTGSFVNWTLSDPIVRWTLPVAVARGTDTTQALALLHGVAAASRFVLAEPKPEAVFVRFGDSTLDLELRVFVDMNALESQWMTGLLQGISQAFADAGIEMSLPQRDVNLKLPSPLLELLPRPPQRSATPG